MSIKSIIFFVFLFLILVYLYFNSEFIMKCQSIIKYIAIIVGILMIFLYPIANQIYGDFDYEELKETMIDKFKKDN